MTRPPGLSRIFIYPVKSLGGIELDSALIGREGIRYDRRWMIVDSVGNFLTQRNIPAMAAIRVAIVDGWLRVAASGHKDLLVDLHSEQGERRSVVVWNDRCDAISLGETARRWLTAVLGTECGLVALPGDTRRRIDPRFNNGDEPVSFADGFPLLLAAEESLAELNSRLVNEVPISRFRPNIVISGFKPFAEDTWGAVRIGESTFRVARPCARCKVTTIDQRSGAVADDEPLKTLAGFRSASAVFGEDREVFGLRPNDVIFGVYLVPTGRGTRIRTGDSLEILESRG